MVNMETAKCKGCGKRILVLAGSLKSISHDKCEACRKREAAREGE